MRIIASFLAFWSLASAVLHFLRPRPHGQMRFLLLRVFAGALAPFWVVGGFVAALLGLVQRRPAVVAAGMVGAATSVRYIARVRQAAAAYGPPPRPDPGATARRDVVVYAAARPPCAGEGDRPVYADVWLPGPNVPSSGAGIVYLHGSAWYLGDKGQLTDGLFRGLAGAGHVVLDLAYRMCPETDLRGMLADAQAAIAWLKEHAAEYGVDPARIVISGTSAGGHIALLTAYTLDRADLRAAELADRDLSVAGVFTISAPVDLNYMTAANPELLTSAYPGPGSAFDPATDPDPLLPPGPGASRQAQQRWQRAQFRRINGLLRDLLGGGPEDVPEMYDLATAATHVRPGLPATLLIQGDQDMLVPVEPTRALYRRLLEAGVPADYLELPQTEHGFELAFTRVSPPAQAALAAIARFLAAV